MSLYIKIATNEYPRYIGDVKIEFPDFEFGDPVPEGWAEVVPALEIPNAGTDEKVVEVMPVEIDGKLVQTFEILPLTDEEKEYRDAPFTAKQKLIDLGLTEVEIQALSRRFIR